MPWTKRRRSRGAGRRTLIRGLLLASLAFTLIPLGWLWHRSSPRRLPFAASDVKNYADQLPYAPYAPDLNPDAASAGWLRRPVYPYSVIPGGVESVAELRKALLQDPVAAGHYSQFDLSRSRIQELRIERVAYVSYRIENRIFWTSRKVRLLRGEKVITDGVNYARARCGNRISEAPPGDSSPSEPPPAEMDNPLFFSNRTLMPVAFKFTPDLVTLVSPAAAVPAQPSETRSSVPTWSLGLVSGGSLPHAAKSSGCPYPPAYPGAPCERPHKPPTVVPEPGTLLLISTGLGFVALRAEWPRERVSRK